VVAGRIADPTLAVAPARAHFGWSHDDWERIGRATMAGHLLECGAKVTGGYFADPGFKDVPNLASVGFPVATIDEQGNCVIGKADGTGGAVTLQTVKEQLLYEVHDPRRT
jgi:predicted enzyme related to lactoylglutathione lyase